MVAVAPRQFADFSDSTGEPRRIALPARCQTEYTPALSHVLFCLMTSPSQQSEPATSQPPAAAVPPAPVFPVPDRRGRPAGRGLRVVLVLFGLFLAGGFSLAAAVKPDVRGFGTHQQFGLPPCSFRSALGIPCPSCGMTTSFSSFVRGQFQSSIDANLAGFLLAGACLALIPWCWFSAAAGRLYFVNRLERAALGLVLPITIVCVLQWLYRVLPLL